MEEGLRVCVLTMSTRASRGESEDTSGPALCGLVESHGWLVAHYGILPDDEQMIVKELLRVCDEVKPDIVFTLGGTGLSPTDVTPDATKKVIKKLVPGISEAIRSKSLEKTDRAMLSRGISGTRGNTLIINMPGSEKAVRESFEIVSSALPHAAEIIKGQVKDCGRE
jgi:molybdopterin adenylyltransferase